VTGKECSPWWKPYRLPNQWEADHIVPLAEGGDSSLENYRTLCIECHKSATRMLRRRISKARRCAQEVLPL